MALQIPPGFGQMSYRFTCVGDPEPMICTLGIDLGGVDPEIVLDSMLDQLEAPAAFPAASVSSDYVLNGGILRVGQDGAPPLVFEDDRVVVGTSVGNPALPPNCAFLVKKHTSLGGRRGRGRMFLPPFSLGEGSVPANGVMAEAQRAAIEIRVRAAFVRTELVLLHDIDVGDPPLAPTPITDLSLAPRIATQRRRLRP